MIKLIHFRVVSLVFYLILDNKYTLKLSENSVGVKSDCDY